MRMSANLARLRAVLRRFLISWYAPAALGVVLLLVLAVWAMPTRVERAVTDPVTGEVHTRTAWDTSNWQALAAVRGQVLILAVVLAALTAGVWAGRGWVLRAAAAARFFAASLLLHALLVLGLWGAPLARAVVEHAEVIRVNQAAQLFDED